MATSNPNQVIEADPNRAGGEDHGQAKRRTAFSPVPIWKRILDVTLVLLALPFLLPVGILTYIFIKVASPGPAFFRQQRMGHWGRRFMCLKFRTMKINADAGLHQAHLKQLMTTNQLTQKLDCSGDKRLIVGAMWLRVTGVDELPQLFNVLLGDMSLVGPRPCTPYEFELLSEDHKHRCEAPPGLTGLWQISGKNKTTFGEMMDLDLKYVREKSLWLDLKIMLLTVPAILKLVWEMILRPRINMQPMASAMSLGPEFPAKTAGPLPGTIPARD
jgi:exopolysaccharide production protein ExoY